VLQVESCKIRNFQLATPGTLPLKLVGFGAPVISLRSLLQFYLLWLAMFVVPAFGKLLTRTVRP